MSAHLKNNNPIIHLRNTPYQVGNDPGQDRALSLNDWMKKTKQELQRCAFANGLLSSGKEESFATRIYEYLHRPQLPSDQTGIADQVILFDRYTCLKSGRIPLLLVLKAELIGSESPDPWQKMV